MLNVVCTKWGNKYGPEYVNRLYSMVNRHTTPINGRFICYTDDAAGIRPEVVVRELHPDVYRWYGFLQLFRAGEFDNGDRIFYLGLDTVICGSIDDMLAYDDGILAQRIVKDGVIGNGVWSMPANAAPHVWDRWIEEGRPDPVNGDEEWIARCGVTPTHYASDLWPGAVVYFKQDCNQYVPPAGAKVVCFSGTPKPHQVDAEWVRMLWSDECASAEMVKVYCNTARETLDRNTGWNLLHYPHIKKQTPHDRVAVICAGGPSLALSFDDIDVHQRQENHTIFAVNGAYEYLRRNLFYPDAQVIMDARPHNEALITKGSVPRYLAAHCDPRMFTKAANRGGAIALDVFSVGYMGSTSGLIAMFVAWFLGYRKLVLYGFDGSIDDAGNNHAYKQAGDSQLLPCFVEGKKFLATPAMARQAQEFPAVVDWLVDRGCEIVMSGNGMIPTMFAAMYSPFRTECSL